MSEGKLFYWKADWSLSRAEAHAQLGGNTSVMVDLTSANVDKFLTAYGKADPAQRKVIRRVAVYITGSDGIRATSEQIKNLDGEFELMLIDQSDDKSLYLSDTKLVKDIETNASTVAVAISVAKNRILSRGENYTLYVSASQLKAVENAAEAAKLPAGQIAAIQYASADNEPNTLIPGLGVKLSEIPCDLSVVHDSWLPAGAPGPAAATVSVNHDGVWSIKGVHVGNGLPNNKKWAADIGLSAGGAWTISGIPAQQSKA